jgi:hypothetical protein
VLIIVRVFPEDRRLAEDARRVALAAAPDATDVDGLRQGTETGLRAWYPRAAIHVREDLAALNTVETLWYVMRDGRVHPDARRDRLHNALATARDVTAEATQALLRSRELVESPPRGRPNGNGATEHPPVTSDVG